MKIYSIITKTSLEGRKMVIFAKPFPNSCENSSTLQIQQIDFNDNARRLVEAREMEKCLK